MTDFNPEDFFHKYEDTLIQISIPQRKEQGIGMLIIDAPTYETNKCNTLYIPCNKLPEKMCESLETHPKKDSTLFFGIAIDTRTIVIERDMVSNDKPDSKLDNEKQVQDELK